MNLIDPLGLWTNNPCNPDNIVLGVGCGGGPGGGGGGGGGGGPCLLAIGGFDDPLRPRPLGCDENGGSGGGVTGGGFTSGDSSGQLSQLLNKLSTCPAASAMVQDLKQLRASGKLKLTNLGAADGSTSFTGSISIDSTNGITAHNLGHEWWHTIQRDSILLGARAASQVSPYGDGPIAGALAVQLTWAGARVYNSVASLINGTPGFGPLDKKAEAVGQQISSKCGVD